MEFTPFERAALQALLGVDDDSTRILRLQVGKASVVSREYTGAGFFTEIAVSADCEVLLGKPSFMRNSVVCGINGIPDFGGVLLFINEGIIDCLEAYTFGEVNWPTSIQDFSCRRDGFQ